jgi:hypothetical protein
MIGRSNANVPGARQLTKYLEMGRGFSISKISVASILGLGSIWAYLHNARNDAERAELYARLFVAVGMVLVFGDVIGNAATAFNLMRMGHGTRGMTGVRDMLSQMTKGQRPLFDFDTVGPLNRKPEAGKPQKGFFGRLGQAISGQRAWSDLFDNGLRGQFDVTSSTLLRENPGLQEALRSNPDLFERQVQKLHFCKHHMPQLMALPVGLGTMVLNYFLVTKTMYKAEYGGVPIASDPQKSEPTESMLKPQGLQSMAVAPSTSGQGSQAHS